MALKVKAKEQLIKVGKYAETYRYVMMPELYTALTQDKVIKEAALRSGVSRGVMQACWDAAGEVIKAWATEGHSVALPGLGTMRFGLRAKSVDDVNKVKAGLISSRRIIFTPDVDLKDELSKTAVQITCYDREGKEVKRVTSTDEGNVEGGNDSCPQFVCHCSAERRFGMSVENPTHMFSPMLVSLLQKRHHIHRHHQRKCFKFLGVKLHIFVEISKFFR